MGTGFVVIVAQIKIDWLRYTPTSWVTSLAGGGNKSAMDELVRRYHKGFLSSRQTGNAIDAGLQIQSSQSPHPLIKEWMDFLGGPLVAQEMSPAQSTTTLKNMATFTIETREIVRQGDALPIVIRHRSKAPSNVTVSVYWLDARIEIGGDVHFETDGVLSGASLRGAGDGGTGWSNSDIPVNAPPGLHEVVIRARRKMFVGRHVNPQDESALYETDDVFRAQVRILPSDAADPIIKSSDPELGATIRDCIAITQAEITLAENASRQHHLFCIIEVGGIGGIQYGQNIISGPNLPRKAALHMGLAFRVFIKSGRFEHEIGTVSAANDENLAALINADVDDQQEFVDDLLNADTVSILLRSDVDVARQTVDVTEIWIGEIQFDNVPITIVGQAAKPTPTPSSQ
ncbi:MAG TPA: hypothetical protein PKN33_10130 [Phycisphaerae bacterium]|nr:hypothetical protein [Phycisphaerae bacterium]